MDRVRIGIVGIGNMGKSHAGYISEGQIKGADLGAVCDIDPNRTASAAKSFGGHLHTFQSAEEMFASGTIDGVLIANLHYDHPSTAIKAFEKGLHVLVEKPAGVYTKQVRQMNEAAEKSGKVFGIMYNQRTNPVFQKVRDLIASGELGAIKRTNWIVTDWYRPQSYYDSGEWRATWAGEGGGVLLNQCPHQLDLWQWMCGMPKRVRAFCTSGKYHNIEVEDDVTAYVEYENGASGVFIASTGEAPGTNRLEIAGDRGKLVVENDKIDFWRLRISERQFNKEYTTGFGKPECWRCTVPAEGENKQHREITQNWVDAVLKGTSLLAPGREGINGLEISNAMYLSSWLDRRIEIPVDEDLYLNKLQEKIKGSTYTGIYTRMIDRL